MTTLLVSNGLEPTTKIVPPSIRTAGLEDGTAVPPMNSVAPPVLVNLPTVGAVDRGSVADIEIGEEIVGAGDVKGHVRVSAVGHDIGEDEVGLAQVIDLPFAAAVVDVDLFGGGIRRHGGVEDEAVRAVAVAEVDDAGGDGRRRCRLNADGLRRGDVVGEIRDVARGVGEPAGGPVAGDLPVMVPARLIPGIGGGAC